MALSKAITFVRTIGSDSELRNKCNTFRSKQDMLNELGFDDIEFDDALNMQLVKCRTYEEAEEFQQLKMWFMLL